MKKILDITFPHIKTMRNPNFASVFKFNRPKWPKIDLKIIFKFEIRISHTFYTKKSVFGHFSTRFFEEGGVYSRGGVY